MAGKSEHSGCLREFLEKVVQSSRSCTDQGKVCDQIPALGNVSRDKFGISILGADGREAWAGDAEVPFSIQSIAKLFTLAMALESVGDPIWKRVGRKASSMRYDSFIQLEQDNGVPCNPFVNSGALVVIDALISRLPCPETGLRDRLRRLSGNSKVDYDQDVYLSELSSGDLNRAAAYYLRARGNLLEDPARVLETYFKCCSMAMSCRDLARAAGTLLGPRTSIGQGLAVPVEATRLMSLMRTCGLYDLSGDFAYRVGLPAKSGVGGGIVAVWPGKFSVCVWSPALDRGGNSIAGLHALEKIVTSEILI